LQIDGYNEQFQISDDYFVDIVIENELELYLRKQEYFNLMRLVFNNMAFDDQQD